jgi:pimeloyl-ACP methyl ester carboxylesterase
LRAGTWGVRRYRKTVADALSLRVGDVLLYQARGEEIRAHIKRTIGALSEPVVLLAHSLGGVACVDLLAREANLKVAALVTVGSQASFLYEIGALWSSTWGGSISPMPPWLNVYDKNDLLSFLAAPVFPNRVTDIEISSHQPFPLSHSAYWTNPKMWREFTVFVAGLSA